MRSSGKKVKNQILFYTKAFHNWENYTMTFHIYMDICMDIFLF